MKIILKIIMLILILNSMFIVSILHGTEEITINKEFIEELKILKLYNGYPIDENNEKIKHLVEKYPDLTEKCIELLKQPRNEVKTSKPVKEMGEFEIHDWKREYDRINLYFSRCEYILSVLIEKSLSRLIEVYKKNRSSKILNTIINIINHNDFLLIEKPEKYSYEIFKFLIYLISEIENKQDLSIVYNTFLDIEQLGFKVPSLKEKDKLINWWRMNKSAVMKRINEKIEKHERLVTEYNKRERKIKMLRQKKSDVNTPVSSIYTEEDTIETDLSDIFGD